ncbi:BACON domain-containing protein [Streptomyces sp. NPDC003691]
MTSSWPNQTSRTPRGTGAHRSHRRAPGAAPQQSAPARTGRTGAQPDPAPVPARDPGRPGEPSGGTGTGTGARGRRTGGRERYGQRYEPYLDGLFTYCLSVLCDHDSATAALGEALAAADRHHGRAPDDPPGDPAPGRRGIPSGPVDDDPAPGRRAWLYALARWACRRRLAERRRARPGAHTGRNPGTHRSTAAPPPAGPGPAGPSPTGFPATDAPTATDTPTAVNPATDPGPGADSASESDSAAESGADHEPAARHRARLALLAWPEAAGTTPEQREALELSVRHGLGTRETAAVLALDATRARDLIATAGCELERTRAALAVVSSGDCPAVAGLSGDDRVLLSAALRTELVRHVDDCPRCRRAAERAEALGPWPGAAPRPGTLPLLAADRPAVYAAMRTARAARTRSGTPRFGSGGFPLDPRDHTARRERLRARALTTTVVATVLAAPVLALWAAYRGAPLTGESHAGPAVTASEKAAGAERSGDPYAPDDAYDRYENTGGTTPGGHPGGVSVEVVNTGTPAPPARPGAPAPGRLGLTARAYGDTTRLTLTASGAAPVIWSVRTGAPWLRFSSTSGLLHPGESVTVLVTVDPDREPAGPWRARLRIEPTGAVLRIDGRGAGPHSPNPRPTRPGEPSGPPPSPRPTASPSPTQSPSPTPTPSPTESEPETSPSPTPSTTEPGPDPSPPDGSPSQSDGS